MFGLIPYAGIVASGVLDEPSALDGERGRIVSGGGQHLFVQPYVTDPVGTMTLILKNVVIGSSYDVEVTSPRSSVVNGIAGASQLSLTIPVYASGNPNNELTIKIRKASSSPTYQPYETQTTAAVGTQTIFINQLSDE